MEMDVEHINKKTNKIGNIKERKKMKKILMLCMSLMMMATLLTGCGSDEKEDSFKVGIIQLMDHTSLNTIQEAITKELDKEEIEYEVKNAGGDTTILDTICKQFVADDVDVIVAITTPASQAAANYAEEVPVIFAAVSDVKEAGLTNDLEKPDLNITGTSDEVQVDLILDLALETYPDTKTIGYLYNSGEPNSVANLKKVEAYAKKNNLKVEKAAVTNAADIQTGLASLLDKSDIIFSPTDNTVASAITQVSEMCKKAKIPMFTGADSMVMGGGFATYGINYEKLGQESAKMAIDVLNGEKVENIPVKIFKEDLNVYINKKTAEAIGFNTIDTLKEKYDVVIVE